MIISSGHKFYPTMQLKCNSFYAHFWVKLSPKWTMMRRVKIFRVEKDFAIKSGVVASAVVLIMGGTPFSGPKWGQSKNIC